MRENTERVERITGNHRTLSLGQWSLSFAKQGSTTRNWAALVLLHLIAGCVSQPVLIVSAPVEMTELSSRIEAPGRQLETTRYSRLVCSSDFRCRKVYEFWPPARIGGSRQWHGPVSPLSPFDPVLDPRPPILAWNPASPECSGIDCFRTDGVADGPMVGIFHRELEQLEYRYTWNAHALPLSGSTGRLVGPTNAVPILQRERDYTIHVTLTVPPDATPGVVSIQASEVMAQTIEEAAGHGIDEIELVPVVLADQEYFEQPHGVPDAIAVDIANLRIAAQADYQSRLMEQHNRMWSTSREEEGFESSPIVDIPVPAKNYFTHLKFSITTRDQPGLGAIAVSLWQDANPIDELVFRFCIAGRNAKCTGHQAANGSGGGGFLMGLEEFNHSDALRDAGLHLVQLGRSNVSGVLRLEADDGSFDTYSWWAARSPEALREQMLRYQRRQQPLHDESFALFNKLFAVKGRSSRLARNALASFTAAAPTVLAHEVVDRPTFNFRFLSTDKRPLLYPLALARPRDQKNLIGHNFRVRHSLQYPRVRQTQSCLRNWWPIVDVSPTDGPMVLARAALNERDTRFVFDDIEMESVFSPWVGSSRLFPIWSNLGRVGEVLSHEGFLPPSGLIFIGHHGDGMFTFDPGAQSGSNSVAFGPEGIAASFSPHSFAILAMCSSADVGWNTLVEGLSTAGVESMIVSTSPIRGPLAGHFVSCFLDSVGAQFPRPVAVGEAFESSLRCMYRRGYDDEVLTFALAGNPDLLLCSDLNEENSP